MSKGPQVDLVMFVIRRPGKWLVRFLSRLKEAAAAVEAAKCLARLGSTPHFLVPNNVQIQGTD